MLGEKNLTQNSMSNEIVLQIWKGNKGIFRSQDLRKSSTSKPALQATLKEVLQDEKWYLMESQTNRKQKASKQQQNNTGNVQYGLESKTLWQTTVDKNHNIFKEFSLELMESGRFLLWIDT